MLEADVKRFGYRRGECQLAEVAVSLAGGRAVLLGPNGAGKTTLLRVLAGVHGYDGTLRLDGETVRPNRSRPRRYRAAVGWLPQHVTPFPGLTAREHVSYIGWLKGLTPRAAASRALSALTQVGLEGKANERAERLSGGQMRRLGIAGVLVHDARYLLLDEPTAGLDPRERDRLVAVLRDIERTRSVLVSTHDTAALIEPSSRVLLLHDGRLRFDGTADQFTERHHHGTPAARLQAAYSSFVPEE
ncbi:ATP-binding cassette domain-containing protein [Agromyces archimandritae]|uniref:ATP-binding cassette domain-containing protein n=1 Tax=Agromyces archimandritae TaxID=2781962 RepID=A0A975IPQ9_9MICO|nr:ATP-binding cassette domain-containing protein [Agromyces archimandritae]QTX05872.1 ATP-binding cassette domain-containing protein [Agromyces archimandritae]